MKLNFPSIAINIIILTAITFPTLQIITELSLHRIPYLMAGLFALFTIFKKGYICKIYLFVYIYIFCITIVGLIAVGTVYTSYLSPVIYGLLFYIIIGKTYQYNFLNLYKFLLVLFLLEFLLINLIDSNLFSFLYNAKFHSYTDVNSKFNDITGIPVIPANTIFYGNHVGPTLLAIMIIIFNEKSIFRILSITLLVLCFSLTSVLIIATALAILNFKKYYLVLLLLMFLMFYIFYYNVLDFSHYYKTFANFPTTWWQRTISEKLFGYPKLSINAIYYEFSYFFIIKNLGLVNVLMLIIMNLILLIKKPNIHTIIVTMLHVSLFHYQPALGLGLVQIFGLHIAYAMRNDHTSEKLPFTNKFAVNAAYV